MVGLIGYLSRRGGADNMFLFVESLMDAAVALGVGPAALSAVSTAMGTGRNQFRMMDLPQNVAWVASVFGGDSKASGIERVQAAAIFAFYFCDVGCFLGTVAPGALISPALAGTAGKYSLLCWGTYVVLSVYTNYKAYKAAKPGSAEQASAKWDLIRQSLWLVCIVNWVAFAGQKLSPLQVSIITGIISGSTLAQQLGGGGGGGAKA